MKSMVYDAKTYCSATYNTHLASIFSADENAELVNVITDPIWIGMCSNLNTNKI